MSTIPVIAADAFDHEVLASAVPVLVEFTADWCGPCRALAPVLEKLAARAGGRAKVLAVDADASAAIAARYRVRALPTVIAFVGGQEHKRHTGTTSLDVLTSLLPA